MPLNDGAHAPVVVLERLARRTARRFFAAIALPLLVALIHAASGDLAYTLLFSLAVKVDPLLPGCTVTALSVAVRLGLVMWAGWRVVARGAGSVLMAGLGGLMVIFVDHLVFKGALMLALFASTANDDALLAFGGVVLSFVLFAPVPFLLGSLGGALARRWSAPAPSTPVSSSMPASP